MGVAGAVRMAMGEIELDLPDGIERNIRNDMSEIYQQRLERLLKSFHGIGTCPGGAGQLRPQWPHVHNPDWVVGYRMHTLAAIKAETGQNFPLMSLLSPANHHDSHFLGPLVNIGKTIGLDLQLITADEAYHDKDGKIFESGVHLAKPPSSNVSLPENVDEETLLGNM